MLFGSQFRASLSSLLLAQHWAIQTARVSGYVCLYLCLQFLQLIGHPQHITTDQQLLSYQGIFSPLKICTMK